MTSGAFHAALADGIAPGGSVGGNVMLPSASSVGCDRVVAKAIDGDVKLTALVDAIVARAGGASAFSAATAHERQSFLEAAQKEMPEAFAALISLTLAHYYAQPEVLAALHWQARAPQPNGHELPAFDDSLLNPVLERGAIWRQT